MQATFPILGTFCTPRLANTSSGAPQSVIIPPYMNGFTPTYPRGKPLSGITHITKLIFTSTTAASHLVTVMRPFNFAKFTADSAAGAGGKVISIDADPGLYATNWKYGDFANATAPGVAVARVADNAIATGDYVAYQCADGTWVKDIIASGTYGSSLTLTTNVPTGGIKAGSLLYFYGVVTDSDPNTGALNPQTLIAASATRDASFADACLGVVNSLHPGDPLIIYDPTTSTGYGVIEACCGYYANV